MQMRGTVGIPGLLIAGKAKRLERRMKALIALGIESSHPILKNDKVRLKEEKVKWEEWCQKNGVSPDNKEEMETVADQYEIELLAFMVKVLERLLAYPLTVEDGRIFRNRSRLILYKRELAIATVDFSVVQMRDLLFTAERRMKEQKKDLPKYW